MTRLAIAVVLLAACDPGTNEPDAEVALDAGPDLGLVPGALAIPCTSVRDVSVDGDRVLVLGRQRYVDEEIGPARVCVSDDRARTFRSIILEEAALEGMETFRVHAGHDRAWILLADRVLGGTLVSARTVVARELDLRAGALGAPIALEVGDYHLGADAIVGLFRTGSRGDPDRRAAFVTLDVATGTVTRTETSTPIGACTEPPRGWPFLSADGSTFARVCYRAEERCIQRASLASGTYEELCTDRLEWPVPWRDWQMDLVLDGAIRRVWNARGTLHAREVLATGLGDATVIGRARVIAPFGRDLVMLSSPGDGVAPFEERLAVLEGGSLVPVAIPTEPCRERATCVSGVRPYEHLAFATPLGAGEWLAIYDPTPIGTIALVTDAGGAPPPLADPGELPEGVGGDWVPVQPGESALERACALAISCPAGLSIHMWDCLEYWERVRGGSADAAYERFVATPPGDCAALAETFPAAFGDCTARCLPDGRSISCADFEYTTTAAFREVRECSAEGAICVVTGASAGCTIEGAACDTCDASGRAVRCAAGAPDEVLDCATRGLVCWVGPTGCRPEPVFLADGTWCEGSTFIRYGGSGVITETRECSRSHLPCHRDYGCRWDGGTSCMPSPTACDGTRMVWHVCNGYTRFVDCLEIGGTGCDLGRCTMP